MNCQFVDKNKNVCRFLATNTGSLADSIKSNINHKNLEHFHGFLCGYTDIFSDNIMNGIMKGTYVETTDNMLKELTRFQHFLYRTFHNYECYKDEI